MSKIPNLNNERRNIAGDSGIETIDQQKILVTDEMMPWLNQDMEVNTVLVKLSTGQLIRYGSAMTPQALKIMEDDFKIKFNGDIQVRDPNMERIDDRMNRNLWLNIGYLMNGQANRVGKFLACPITANYVKDNSTKARLFFAFVESDDNIPTVLRFGYTFTTPGEKRLMTYISQEKQSTKGRG